MMTAMGMDLTRLKTKNASIMFIFLVDAIFDVCE